ncbi:UvrD/REP helicase [Flavobacterium saliperosum S13]|uniref:DNA 3'-5' helicase n=2 Tax=Flavobacterium saliperosum TaxID=329186 RepID=A0A1G4W6U6_9FLAO|nr:UvrD-helicase domain-containing protein [Flavobacterium saliperosum]ESU23028.1 UvrD/REP helicase [Flavobacterium saliperosum S13]SCX17657.1 ATP-dependent exoDNAse (exonuclease V) beta subunit (contains helicase and exonuclease domains) [Flavobacterium saliperosum]
MEKSAFIIYDASAGSGKTYTLVKEYLKILMLANTNDAYKKILAITFTNKAVEEMKSRIVTSLHEFSKDEPSEKALDFMKDVAAETNLSLATIKDKSKAIIKNIIHNYAAFDISTIDKFTHKVIRAFAHDLNLPVTFEVSLETDLLLQEAVDAIIAKAGEDEVLTKILVDFSVDKTDNDKSWDVTHELFDVSKLLVNENNRNEISHFHEKTIDEFLVIKQQLSEEIKKLDEECVAFANEALQLIESNAIDVSSFSRGTFPNHLGYIQKGELKSSHKKFFEPDDIQVNKTAKDKAIIESIAPEWIAILAKVYKNYEKKNFYSAFQKNITPLSLLNSIAQELDAIQKEKNILSISEFNAIIYNEIQNQPAPFIYERLGERYKHFFIDEFQDTSEMQWHNLVPLIDNALSSEDLSGAQGSLMIVGDPKQSIYRWRGGKAEQFISLSKTENPFSNPSKQLVRLGTNYRSYSEVIAFNNAFFAMLADEFSNEDYQDLYRNKSHQEANTKKGGYVNISFIPKVEKSDETSDEETDDKEQLYLKATLATIEKVKAKGFQYRDIVLLTRKRTSGVALANYLTENDIPILSSETLLIDNATEVKLILNVLRYLKNSNDKEAKAAFLYFIAKNKQTELPIHDFIETGMTKFSEEELQNWLMAFGIGISFKNCRKKSLYEAVEIIVSTFIKEKSTVSYVQYFMDLVLERDVRTQAGISDFLEYWENNGTKFSIPSPEGNDAVRIMTIHKSKGLEFPVVIFPFAEEDYARSPRNKMWLELEDDNLNIPKALVDAKKEVAEYGDNAAQVYEERSQEELLDNINVLYVALTRAEEQLYVISNKNLTSKGELTNNMSSYFIKYLDSKGVYQDDQSEFEFGDGNRLSASKDEKEKQPTIEIVKEVFNPKKIKIAQREALMWGTDQIKAIEFGNVMHEILSFVKTASDVHLAIEKAIESGLITESQKPEVERTLSEIVCHPELQRFFEADKKVFNEQNIIKPGTATIKPDRVSVQGNLAYLLDYKTGSHQTKYEAQLAEYEKALQEMGFSVEKKTLVYIGEKLEVVHL